ncbi:NAD(P)/FAD-dependent oxidoreductase [Mycobacterium sp. CBMA271]|uniref:flavin-containing monooxygenase n=1 Tax=unclassified Mycobacteroides TaxID=2618759 RepID=UPI0012DD7CA4|nr:MULTISPECIES: NAD(P)/FAD-dependent oxidoreductase [unclassified Mycobacteroides]MUM18080.1 monooxygenase [Mycobacteroides sp. CBMA 326]MUM23436.1 NAD(P)/FAD-dependent oxidoreductase [Mycobacteroides sp. CBMA 271]
MSDVDCQVAIIGAGPGGIAAAHYLLERGIDDFVILDRADDFGGTWRDNTYPGLAVDIPVLFYQLSFARTGRWNKLFADGADIQRYHLAVVDDLGIRKHFQGDSAVTAEHWNEDDDHWELTIAGKPDIRARYVISAVGGYIDTKPGPDIPGLDDFRGRTMRPNAWDHSYDYAGKRAAVIGTGSSGIQIAPAVAETAASVTTFQRTPAWIIPKPNPDLSPRVQRILGAPFILTLVNALVVASMDVAEAVLFHLLPLLPESMLRVLIPRYDAMARRWYRNLLRDTVRDPKLRDALMPGYGILARRTILSNDFLQAVDAGTVRLVTEPIVRITETGIETADGAHHNVDLLVLATGYEIYTDPEHYRSGTVQGRGGFDLGEYYRDHEMRTYGGSALPGLPNRWVLVGPEGNQGQGWHAMVEANARHAARIIAAAGRGVAEVTQPAFDAWVRRMARQSKAIRLYATDCQPPLSTYFVNSKGEARYYRPQTVSEMNWFSRHSPISDYSFRPVSTEAKASS